MERRDEQSIEAVKLYYQQGLSQAEVATRMGLSRPTVAKLLAHGRERGFVTIEIADGVIPEPRSVVLETVS